MEFVVLFFSVLSLVALFRFFALCDNVKAIKEILMVGLNVKYAKEFETHGKKVYKRSDTK